MNDAVKILLDDEMAMAAMREAFKHASRDGSRITFICSAHDGMEQSSCAGVNIRPEFHDAAKMLHENRLVYICYGCMYLTMRGLHSFRAAMHIEEL
jgi:hypothetical protein